MTSDHIYDAVDRGISFNVDGTVSIANAGTYTFVGVPDAIEAHFYEMSISASDGPVTIEFIESPTVSDFGTETIPNNHRRSKKTASRLRAYAGATISGGTVIASSIAYGGTGPVQPTSALIGGEWVLDPALTYAVRLTNTSGGTASVTASLNFYEEDI